jgi:integrase
MAKNTLNARKVESATPGRYCDGQGLWLAVSPTGFKRWLYRFTLNGKTSEVALGKYPAVTLEGARELAEQERKLHRAGANPVEVRRRAKEQVPVPTFEKLAGEFFAVKSPEWRSPIHTRQWLQSLQTYAGHINPMRVDTITVADILKVLQPIWLTAPETASRVRGRIESVLDYAKAKGFFVGENPAVWRGNLGHLLPGQKRRAAKEHFEAMDYRDVPAFVARLRSRPLTSALALEFVILTACRGSEVRGAEWKEFDIDAGVWTIPAKRMKAGKLHRVPLSPRALEILETMKAARTSEYVFPARPGGPLNPSAMNRLLERLNISATPHGFRSSFRDWAGDETSFPREIAEAALAHSVGNAVENAYRRSDALERRRQLMDAWALHCDGGHADNVVAFAKPVAR